MAQGCFPFFFNTVCFFYRFPEHRSRHDTPPGGRRLSIW